MPKNSQLNHLAVIMDGNRRWAKNRGLLTLEGHRRGYNKMKKITQWCIEDKVKILTVYAFSTENWNRSKKEVGYLMDLFRFALDKDVAEMHKQGVKVKIIGQVERLDSDIQALVKKLKLKLKTIRNYYYRLLFLMVVNKK